MNNFKFLTLKIWIKRIEQNRQIQNKTIVEPDKCLSSATEQDGGPCAAARTDVLLL